MQKLLILIGISFSLMGNSNTYAQRVLFLSDPNHNKSYAVTEQQKIEITLKGDTLNNIKGSVFEISDSSLVIDRTEYLFKSIKRIKAYDHFSKRYQNIGAILTLSGALIIVGDIIAGPYISIYTLVRVFFVGAGVGAVGAVIWIKNFITGSNRVFDLDKGCKYKVINKSRK